MDNLSFLGASNIIKSARFKESRTLILLSSSSIFQLEIYLKAQSALLEIDLEIKNIPFGALKQHIITNDGDSNDNSILLSPWDFCPSLDWRTGFPSRTLTLSEISKEVESFKNLLSQNKYASVFYLPANVPPVTRKHEDQVNIELMLNNAVNDLGAIVLEDNYFCLNSFLASGCPIGGTSLAEVAKKISSQFFNNQEDSKKIIVTDLDNTLWSGILGEDGIDVVKAASEGKGFLHFIYQSYLKNLKESGVLLSICSKNDKDLVEKVFIEKDFILNIEDFVCIQASYNAKSLQIKELAKSLNLGLESFVFIDDNPVEIHEVQSSIPEATCILFSANTLEFIEMFNSLTSLFPISNITQEDMDRTKLYRSMKESVEVIDGGSNDMTLFLKSLEMKVQFFNRSTGNNDRAIQLINKTNQFNLNGERVDVKEVDAIINNGGSLFSASLSDINGEYGEVISILIDKDNEIKSFVMSCRVFQRKLEFIFLSILLSSNFDTMKMRPVETDRNSAMKIFLTDVFGQKFTKDLILNKEYIDKACPNLDKIFLSNNIKVF